MGGPAKIPLEFFRRVKVMLEWIILMTMLIPTGTNNVIPFQKVASLRIMQRGATWKTTIQLHHESWVTGMCLELLSEATLINLVKTVRACNCPVNIKYYLAFIIGGLRGSDQDLANLKKW